MVVEHGGCVEKIPLVQLGMDTQQQLPCCAKFLLSGKCPDEAIGGRSIGRVDHEGFAELLCSRGIVVPVEIERRISGKPNRLDLMAGGEQRETFVRLFLRQAVRG